MLSQQELRHQQRIAQGQVARADERNRLRDSRRQQAVADARIMDLHFALLRELFIPHDVHGKRTKTTFLLGLFLGPLGLACYFHSLGTFVRWFVVAFLAGVGSSCLLHSFPDFLQRPIALLCAWLFPTLLATLRVFCARI